MASTHATVITSPLAKRIKLNSSLIRKITLRYNVQQEAERRENLISNRGYPTVSTANEPDS